MLSVLQPVGGKEEVEELRDTIESGWWAKGPKVAKFEKEFAKMVGAKYAIAITSATPVSYTHLTLPTILRV